MVKYYLSRFKWPELFISFVLIASTVVIYWQVVDFSFIYFDDDSYIFENPHVQNGLTIESITWAFATSYESTWQPLIWLSFMLDNQLYGLDPGWYHFTNLLFHLLNTILLFFVMRKMTGALWRSALVAILFAIHPLHVESVAWITERKDMVSTFFWMLTLLAYGEYVSRPRPLKYLTILLFFALGLMAKPMLVTLPFVLLLLDYWPLNRITFIQPGKEVGLSSEYSVVGLIQEKIPLFLLAAFSCIITYYVQLQGGSISSFDVSPLGLRVANGFVSYIKYIFLFFWPYQLGVMYPYPLSIPLWQSIGSVLLLLMMSFVTLRSISQRPYLAVGWLWFLGTLVPVIGMVQISSHAMADRFTYVPTIGLSIMVAWLIPTFKSKWHFSKIIFSTATVIVLVWFMISSWIQIQNWQNTITLFEHTLEVTDNNYLAHNNLGVALERQGRIKDALEHYREACRINPKNLNTCYNFYSRLLLFEPENPSSHYNLAILMMKLGKNENEVAHHLKESIRLSPENALAHNLLGVILARSGKIDFAIFHFQAALKQNPANLNIQKNLNRVLEMRARD